LGTYPLCGCVCLPYHPDKKVGLVEISEGILWIRLQNIHDIRIDVSEEYPIYRATKKCTATGGRNITWHKKNTKQTYRLAVVLQSGRETNIDSS